MTGGRHEQHDSGSRSWPAWYVVAGTVVGCGDDSKAADATQPTKASAQDARIVFTSERDGNPEIYVVNADGSGLKRLTNTPSEDRGPVPSPDGKSILFASNRDGNFELYRMEIAGQKVTRLTKDPADEGFASWSPDGSRIAFASNREQSFDIYVMNAGGTGVRSLTQDPADEFAPEWSPSGDEIVFDRDEGGENFELYVVGTDGGKSKALAHDPAGDSAPAWSPGESILFTSDRGGNDDLYVVNGNGTGLKHSAITPATTWEAPGPRTERRSPSSAPVTGTRRST